MQYSPLCCNRLAWLRDIVSQYTWVYCDQGHGSWARWGVEQALGKRADARASGRRAGRAGCPGLAGAGGAAGRSSRSAQSAGQGWLGGRRAAWALGARPGRWARSLGARARLRLCTRCTRPVFGPVRLGIFLSQIFWTLFVNPVHEHCSSRNFSKKKIFFKNI